MCIGWPAFPCGEGPHPQAPPSSDGRAAALTLAVLLQVLATYALIPCGGKACCLEEREKVTRAVQLTLDARDPVLGGSLYERYNAIRSPGGRAAKAWADPLAERLRLDRQVVLHRPCGRCTILKAQGCFLLNLPAASAGAFLCFKERTGAHLGMHASAGGLLSSTPRLRASKSTWRKPPRPSRRNLGS